MASHSEIAELWVAHNLGKDTITVTRGRRSSQHSVVLHVHDHAKGSRVSFRDGTIYSHHWWPMASFVRNGRGERAVLVRMDKYSKSTGKHQHHTRRALDHCVLPMLCATGDTSKPDHVENLDWYRREITSGLDRALAAQTHMAMHLGVAGIRFEELQDYCEFFDVPMPKLAATFESEEDLVQYEGKLAQLSLRAGVEIPKFWRSA